MFSAMDAFGFGPGPAAVYECTMSGDLSLDNSRLVLVVVLSTFTPER